MVKAAFTPREIVGKPSTERVKKLWDQVITSTQYVDSQRMELYTEYMKGHWAEPLYTRRGGAFKYVMSHLKPVILDGELIVGRMSPYARGTQLYPENESQWMRETLEGIERAEEVYAKGVVPADREEKGRISIYKIEEEDRPRIAKALEFYQEDWRTVSERTLKEREDFDIVEKWQRELVFYRLWWDVPEGRAIVNYGDVLEEGLQAIIDKCYRRIRDLHSLETKEKVDKHDFYRGTILALEGAIAFAESYAREAQRLAAETTDEKRKAELLEIARICDKVPRYRADTFREAVQSFWFTHLMVWLEQNARGISPGRFDQYMYRPFKSDIDSGRITEAEALELLELLRVKHTEIVRAHSKFMESNVAGSTYQHVTLGGVDKHGVGADNELSKLVLQAGINARTPQPTLSVLWCDELSHDFKVKVVECIKAGSGYPALFNNKVGIDRFRKVTGVSIEEAREWAPCACIDVQLPGKRTPSWVVSHVNMLKLLECVLNDGVNPVTGTKLFETGIKNIEGASLEEIRQSFINLMALVLKKQAEYWNIAMVIKNKMGLALPFTSALLDDCIERGLHCQEGGCRYNDGAYLMTCGMVNVANALAAMKQCIFEKKLFTMKEMKEALEHNFEGYEEIRRHLLKAPKFGNANDYVDDILVELYHLYVQKTEENPNWLGVPWRASALSVTTEVVYGNTCGATPDGRKKGEQVADGSVSAYPGTDTCGPTALMRSAARPNHVEMDANLLNVKFHPSAVEGLAGSEKFIALNDAYFDLGPYHVQYNIVDSKMLRDAQERPDNYQDLMIRVAGFTVRWVEIGKLLQDALIRRTEYEEV